MEDSTESRDPSRPDPPTSMEDDKLVEREDEREDSEATTPGGPTGLDAIDGDLARKDRLREDKGVG